MSFFWLVQPANNRRINMREGTVVFISLVVFWSFRFAVFESFGLELRCPLYPNAELSFTS